MSEFAKVGNGSRIVSTSGRFLIPKAPQIDRLPVDRDPSHKGASLGGLENTLVARAVIAILASVSSVLRRRAFPKVGAAIIQCVLVAVIVALTAHDLILHVDASAVIPSDGVVGSGAYIESGIPTPLRKLVVVRSVHDGIESLGQRNQLNGRILRLKYGMPSLFHVGNRSTERVG
jgi:hypothetical protein